MPAKQSIHVLKASGKSHLSKKEIAEREESELRVDLFDVSYPEYLPKKLRPKFNDLKDMLMHINIMTELDEDALARYVVSENSYIKYSLKAFRLLEDDDADILELEKISNLQDKAFKQCRSIANDLGLSIASRCKLVAPVNQLKDEKPTNKFAKFEKTDAS